MDGAEKTCDRLEALRLEQEWFSNMTEALMCKSPSPPPPSPPPAPAPEAEEADDYFGSFVPADADSEYGLVWDNDNDSGLFKFEMDN